MQSGISQTIAGPTLHRNKSGSPSRAILALALALLTGLTLGQLHLLGGGITPQSPGVSRAATHTGMEFYDAVDAYLTTGQTATLRRLLDPEVVNHIDGQAATTGIDAFLEQLDTLRAFDAGTRFTATPISSSTELAQFAVTISPEANARALGLPFTAVGRSEASDTLRIVDGQIAERWSNLQLPVAVAPLASITWDPPPASQMLPAIERVTMLRGSEMTLRWRTEHVVVVEQGALRIEGTPQGTASSVLEFLMDSTDLAGVEPIVVLSGSTLVAAGNSPYRIVNEGPGVASALIIRIAGYAASADGPVFGQLGTSRNDVGVQIETLAAATELPHHKGAWKIEIGRATLAPGTDIPTHAVAGSELLYVEQGTLQFDLDTCAKRCVQTIDGAGTFTTEPDSLRAGQGISAGEGATLSYRVADASPAAVLIVTLAPA